MNLTLKVTPKEKKNIATLVWQMCLWNCRVKVDFEKGDIIITGIEDSNVERAIRSINESFNISNINIMPQETEEEVEETPKNSAEKYLAEFFSDELNMLEKEKPAEEQIDAFLDAINFPRNESIVRDAFIFACTVRKIKYESIITEIYNATFPKLQKEILKNALQEEFDKWIALYPEIKEKCPKISIITLLKVFAKKIK